MFLVVQVLIQRTSDVISAQPTTLQIPVSDPTEEPPGFDLPRNRWSALNRIRTLHARISHHLYKWNFEDSPAHDCGHPDQTIHHIVNECHLQKFDEGCRAIHRTESAVTWLPNLDVDL